MTPTQPFAHAARPWSRRCPRKTHACRACPTPARPSGTWPTPPGSSRHFVLTDHLPGYRGVPRTLRLPVQLLLLHRRPDAPASAPRAADAAVTGRSSGLPGARRCGDGAAARTGSGPRGTGATRHPGPAPRTAAPGADPHRHQAPAGAEPAAAGLSRSCRPQRRSPAMPLEWRAGHGGDRARSGTPAPGSPSTTKRRATARCCATTSWPRAR